MKRIGITTKRTYCARLVPVFCILGLVGCSKPAPLEFNNVCRKENDNAYVSVEGYLRTGSSVVCSSREGTRSCGLELVERLDGGSTISVYVEEGTGNSQMEPLPKNYGRENLRIRTGDGKILGAEDRVRVIGIAQNGAAVVDSSYSICYINVEEIEKP